VTGKAPCLPTVRFLGKQEFCKNKIDLNIQELIEILLLNTEINFGSQMQA
jgi:hypothetical protein